MNRDNRPRPVLSTRSALLMIAGYACLTVLELAGAVVLDVPRRLRLLIRKAGHALEGAAR